MMHPRPLSRLKVLVVDDDPLLQRAMKEMLSLCGCTCVTANNGLDAKDVLRRTSVDVVVTDWVMAPVGGSAFVRWLRGDTCPLPGLPVIVLTAQADVPTVRAAWDSGVDAVLAKPAPAMEIVKRIETVMRRPRRGPADHRRDGHPHDIHHGDPPAGEAVFVHLPPPRKPSPARPAALPHPGADHGETPRPDGQAPIPADAMRLPSPAASARDTRRRGRIVAALERLEAFAATPQANMNALWPAVADLQHAAANQPGAEAIAASLAACVTGVDARAPGFAEAFQAHLAALRWLLSRSSAAEAAEAALLQCLRSTVRSLLDLSPPPPRPTIPRPLRFRAPPNDHMM